MGKPVYAESSPFFAIEESLGTRANAAIAALNGVDFDGRPVEVDEAKPQTKKTEGRRAVFGQGR